MKLSIVDFISTALRGSMECSVADLRALTEYEALSALEVVRAVSELCAKVNIDCNPALTVGELEDRRVFSAAKSPDVFAAALVAALNSGEGHTVEYKQTLGLNVGRLANDATARPEELFSEDIIHEVVKTIVAFLNADGGVLLIGVCDDGSCYGIENEFPYLGGGNNLDQWELRLNSALDSFIPDYRLILGYIRYAIVSKEQKNICIVMVDPRRDRLSVCRRSNKDGADEIVYRRSGNQSPKLQPRHIEAHILNRIQAGR